MLNTITSAGSTSSQAPSFSRRRMKKSLADELDLELEDVSLSPADYLNSTESPKDSGEEITEKNRGVGDRVPGKCEQFTDAHSQSRSPAIADSAPESPAIFVVDDEQPPTAETFSNIALGQPPRKSNFVEHCSPVESVPQPKSFKEHTTLMASTHNRKVIDRNADGFFNMETMPSVTDVQRRVQQSKGIAALQRTPAPATLSDTDTSSTGSSHASSSTAVDSVKRPSTLRQVTFAEPKGRRSNNIQGPYPYTVDRTQASSRFSLGRDLVAAGQRKKLPEPSAPAKFVRLPTDPVVDFKRRFGDFGLKVTIPDPELDEDETDDTGSITSVPDVDSAGNLKLKADKDADSEAPNGSHKFGSGVQRVFDPNQCLESSCPIRWAHAKGPYHHMGDRHNRIMTGLFGHSNPPPEIWNAYRNMLQLTCDGEVISPDGRLRSKADEDLVIAFATFHFGELNGVSGKEFHRRYAGRHMSSLVALQPPSTKSSKGSCNSCLGSRK